MIPQALQLSVFDSGIEIHCADPEFHDWLALNFAASLTDHARGDTQLEYHITRLEPDGFVITRGGETQVRVDHSDAVVYEFVYCMEKLLTIDLQKIRSDLFVIHAAALERNGGVIMLVAESGTGKSTTAWALLHHGFAYLSDELAAIDPHTLKVHPYPHALCLKSRAPGPYPLPVATLSTGQTLHIPTSGLPDVTARQALPLRAILFLRRESPRSRAEIARISPGEASARLYANALNALAHPQQGLQPAIRIAGEVPGFAIDVGDLQLTCEAISELEKTL